MVRSFLLTLVLSQLIIQTSSSRIIDRRTELNPKQRNPPVGVCGQTREQIQLAPHDGIHRSDLPECDPEGFFTALQCHDLQPLCWCVNPKTGQMISGTERRIGPLDLPPNCGACTVVSLKLESEQSDTVTTNRYIPQCSPDGTYNRVQCDAGDICWCADPLTGEARDGTHVRKPAVPDCDTVEANEACGANEELQPARCSCCPEATCQTPRQLCCLALCLGEQQCGCKPGYVRDADSNCVQPQDCKVEPETELVEGPGPGPGSIVTSPEDSDSEQNCPNGWSAVQGKCYKLMLDAPLQNWVTAVHLCALYNARLPVFSDAQQWRDFLQFRRLVSTKDTHAVWLGLHDLENEGQYTWLDSTPHDPINDFSFWYSNEARNPSDSARDCVASIRSASIPYNDKWVSLNCEQNYFQVICQREQIPSSDVFGFLEKFVPEKEKNNVTKIVTGVGMIIEPFVNTTEPDQNPVFFIKFGYRNVHRIFVACSRQSDEPSAPTSPKMYMQLMVIQSDGDSRSVNMGDTQARTVIETLYKSMIHTNQTIQNDTGESEEQQSEKDVGKDSESDNGVF